jgi:hypothetical protein
VIGRYKCLSESDSQLARGEISLLCALILPAATERKASAFIGSPWAANQARAAFTTFGHPQQQQLTPAAVTGINPLRIAPVIFDLGFGLVARLEIQMPIAG